MRQLHSGRGGYLELRNRGEDTDVGQIYLTLEGQ